MTVRTLGAGGSAFALKAVAVAALKGFNQHIGVMQVRAARAGGGSRKPQIGAMVAAGVNNGTLVLGFTFRALHGKSWQKGSTVR
ncbi:MAG: hypothetical protein JST38_21600 [Bacteroidetes bacterium]|nr:hypothetical protein [Bacteroidota bacterium]MBS1943467.1 hypothetical protein [Bacteroidota bacterium]